MTNGITPALAVGLQSTLECLDYRQIGDASSKDLKQLQQLNRYADDASFQAEFMAIKHANKVDLRIGWSSIAAK